MCVCYCKSCILSTRILILLAKWGHFWEVRAFWQWLGLGAGQLYIKPKSPDKDRSTRMSAGVSVCLCVYCDAAAASDSLSQHCYSKSNHASLMHSHHCCTYMLILPQVFRRRFIFLLLFITTYQPEASCFFKMLIFFNMYCHNFMILKLKTIFACVDFSQNKKEHLDVLHPSANYLY